MLICLFGKPTKKEAEILRVNLVLPEEATVFVVNRPVSGSSIIIISVVCRHYHSHRVIIAKVFVIV